MLLTALFSTSPAHAACDAHVPADFATVQAAIDASAVGDTVCVDAGVWVENLVVDNRILTISGVGRDLTVLDGGFVDRVVLANRSTLALTDLTLQNGASDIGGGLLVEVGEVTLSQVDVVDNLATIDGGGVYSLLSTVALDHVRVLRNHADWRGGGIALNDSTLVGYRSVTLIAANSAVDAGGGLWASASDVNIDNVSFLGNVADNGGGFDYSDVTGQLMASVVAGNRARTDGGGGRIEGLTDNALVNVSVVGNAATDGAGLEVGTTGGAKTAIRNTAIISGQAANMAVGGVLVDAGGNVVFAWDDFWGNSGLDVTAGQPDPVGVNGTIAADPAFVDVSGKSPGSWDLHLQPSSPLIDAGNPSWGDPDGSRSDIGAYGGFLAE